MAKDRIKILGNWSAWDEPVRQGRLIRPDGESIWILMLRCPDLEFGPEEWKTQKTHSRLISRIDHPAVLRLLHAAKIQEAPAWIYEGFQGVSMKRVLAVAGANGDYFSARAALEAVERTVQGLRAAIRQGASLSSASDDVYHPGPSPDSLLLDAVGAVKLAGFVLPTDGEDRVVEGYTPTEPGTPEQRASYGVAALLVHLLGGERPGEASSDSDRQNAVIRRALIRVLARPGEAVPEAVVDLIKAGLAVDPDERPELTVYEDVLAEAAGQLRSPSLRVWAPTAVPGLLKMQETGFPELEKTRSRRHIDLTDDSSSYEVPPIRSNTKGTVPREVATVMAKVDVAAALEAASEDASRDSFGGVSQTSFAAIPTSETDVKLATPEIRMAEGSAPAPVPLDIGGPDDTWEIEPSVEGRMGGWPLVAGLLIGMIVAAVVGWIVVEQMGEDLSPTPQAEAPPPVAIPLPAPAADATDAESKDSKPPSEVVSPETDELASTLAIQETEEPTPSALNTLQVAEPAEEVSAPAVQSTAANTMEESTEAEESVAPTEAPPVELPPDEFTVSFRNASLDIERMVVKCHKGGSSHGDEVIYISRAGKGPCRVEAGLHGEKMVVSVVVTGPQDFTCFEDNARVCQ